MLVEILLEVWNKWMFVFVDFPVVLHNIHRMSLLLQNVNMCINCNEEKGRKKK